MNDGKELLKAFFTNTGFVSSNKTDEIITVFAERVILKNDYYLKYGFPSDEYLFLESGFMRAFTFDTEGNDVTTAFYASGNVVFEVSSFFNRTISRENIQALTDCRGWSITFEQLNSLFHNIPEFREFGRGILVKNLTTLKQRMLSMINDTAETRYDALVKGNPEIFQHAALKHIASYLGITDSSLSRIRAAYQKK
ncbi:MAG: Crp/Fnr family transcriptional regulator [Ferruginibacter sp.]